MSNKIYIKVNGVWREADSVHRKRNGVWQKASDSVYKKLNGAWVNQGDKSAIFDQDALFVYNGFRVDENTSAHVNVTCFDGGNGSVTVVASGGTPPYQYSLDPTFATYNTDGVFSNLSLVGPVDEGTDQYGGILISHRRFYVRDASGQIVSCVVDLQSPVELEWLNCPNDIIVFCDPAQNYATIVPNVDFIAPSLSTLANFTDIEIANLSPDNHYPIGTRSIAYYTEDACKSYDGVECTFLIKVLPLYFPNAITDYDGNWYDAVVIGDQVWLAQNLRTTHYADGTPIPAGGSTTSDTDPYYYDYSSSVIPLKDRGYLYNWPAVMKGAASSDLNPSGVHGIAPTGWHVPSDAEWTQLTNYVGSVPAYILNNNSSYIAKALASQNYWNASTNAYAVGNDLTANNKTLFGGVPAGNCVGSSFFNSEGRANFWSSAQSNNNNSYIRTLLYGNASVTIYGNLRYNGYSVRCVCDLSPMDFAAWYYNQYGSYNHQLPTE